jgi:hypothetical protein
VGQDVDRSPALRVNASLIRNYPDVFALKRSEILLFQDIDPRLRAWPGGSCRFRRTLRRSMNKRRETQ